MENALISRLGNLKDYRPYTEGFENCRMKIKVSSVLGTSKKGLTARCSHTVKRAQTFLPLDTVPVFASGIKTR